MSTMNKVAVIGSGISGLVCARDMLRRSCMSLLHPPQQQASHNPAASDGEVKRDDAVPSVIMFDMSTRGPGGRSTTRVQQGYQFDHGLSFVASASQDLKGVGQMQQELENQGVLKAWKPPVTVFDTRIGEFVKSAEAHGDGFCGALRPGLMCGSPSSNSIPTHLADGISTESGTTVKRAVWDAAMKQWQLSGLIGVHKDATPGNAGSSPELDDLGSYDALVIADAAVIRPGSAGFIDFEADSPGFSDLRETLQGVQHNPSFSLMVAFPRSLGLNFGACQLVGHDALMFLSCDSSKPGRQREDGHECWVAIANSDFARKLLEAKPVSVDGKYNPQTKKYLDSLLPKVLDQFLDILPGLGAQEVPKHSFAALQRWGAGFVANPIGQPVLTSKSERLIACGDFCLGSRFELAVESGLHASETLHSWR